MKPQFINDEVARTFVNDSSAALDRTPDPANATSYALQAQAHQATIAALRGKKKKLHAAAAEIHDQAARAFREDGDEKSAKYHERKAAYHRQVL